MKRVIGILALVSVLSIGGWLWASNRHVHIAFVGELSTSASELSVESREAFLYVVDQYNKKGGVLGQKIEPLVFDDTNDNAYKAQLLKKLEAEDVKLIVGFNVSAMTPTINYLMENGDFLIISPTVTTDEMTGKDDRFIKISPPNDRQIDPLYTAVEKHDMEKMLIVYNTGNLQYTKGLVNTMTKKMTDEGRQIVGQIPLEGKIDFEEITNQLIKTQADSLFIVMNGSDTAQIVQYTRINGFEGHVLTGTWAATSDLIENSGQYGNELYTCEVLTGNMDPENYPIFSAYIKEKTGGQLNFSHTRAYNATTLLLEGIKKTNSTDPEAIKKAILNFGEYQGIETRITLDENGDTLGKYQLIQIQNGKFVKVD